MPKLCRVLVNLPPPAAPGATGECLRPTPCLVHGTEARAFDEGPALVKPAERPELLPADLETRLGNYLVAHQDSRWTTQRDAIRDLVREGIRNGMARAAIDATVPAPNGRRYAPTTLRPAEPGQCPYVLPLDGVTLRCLKDQDHPEAEPHRPVVFETGWRRE